MQCEVMEEQGMEITLLHKETKGEKMLSYLSTSFSQPSQEKREQDVQMPTTTINISPQNNPQGLSSHIPNINSTSTKNNAETEAPCSSNTIRSTPTSSILTNSTYCGAPDNDITRTQDATFSYSNPIYPTQYSTTEGDTTTTSQSTAKEDDTVYLSLLELAWEDILFSHLFLYLSWKDLFNLRATSSKSKEMIDHFFNKIKSVNLSSYRSSFTLNAFQVLSSNCSNLRKIALSYCPWTNDIQLSKIFKNNPRLSEVDLGGCFSLTGSCVLALSVNCKMLKILKLRECNWLSRGAIDTIITHLKLIEHIDFTSCSALSNQQFIPFSQAFPGLKKICIGHIKGVNDTTLVAFSRNCGKMETLDIRACMCVTDNGIRSVSEYCVNLKELYVASCHLVTDYSLNTLRLRSNDNIVIDRPPNGVATRWPLPRLHLNV